MSKPKEILINAINNYLRENLEKEGFVFYEKSTEFKKKGPTDFTYIINFLGSRTNWLSEFVNFNVQYLIYAPKYKSWYKKNFPDQLMLGGGYLYGNNKILRQQSNKYHHGFGYDFVKFSSEDIMEEILTNYISYGVPYFDSASDWSKVYENAVFVPYKIDSLIFQDKLEEALKFVQSTIGSYIESYETEENIPRNLSQNYDILKSRLTYLENKGGL